MSLQDRVMEEMKAAMKAKDSVALESLRAIKSALLMAKTEKGGGKPLTEADEIALVQKQVKQRKESAAIYQEQGREDLAGPELAQVAVLERFLPEQLSEAEIEQVVAETIEKLNAGGMQDMGKVMGAVTQQLAGSADGKTIAAIVRKKLAS
ncbi:GatB/YqeY domain-containing protein [Robiginitalea sp. SC105]|uniref:GatB/YqeY domain-containing protein n=1 Tax=Robiginitalea sp. SC105 TaxID=2762332 RepID=UPI00163A05F6|nr:GatB/YqeY domain-containing protein [Robiginitalea sp. SC105]MBC2838990.1 GatB/YqeY domain-containing protein [Robiginitalea sp. SC105]